MPGWGAVLSDDYCVILRRNVWESLCRDVESHPRRCKSAPTQLLGAQKNVAGTLQFEIC
jgi:hypothetical protein